MIVADVAKNCEKEVRCAVKAAERTARDVLVMRCRCQAVPGDKDSFLETVEQAFGGPLEQKLKAKILLSYHKITRDKVNKFLLGGNLLHQEIFGLSRQLTFKHMS